MAQMGMNSQPHFRMGSGNGIFELVRNRHCQNGWIKTIKGSVIPQGYHIIETLLTSNPFNIINYVSFRFRINKTEGNLGYQDGKKNHDCDKPCSKAASIYIKNDNQTTNKN